MSYKEKREIFIAQQHATNLLKKQPIISKAQNVKPLTIRQIDAIKHKVRKISA